MHGFAFVQLIPVGADILLNMVSVLCNPEVFEEPYSFKPERFLTGDIELKKRHAVYFGLGKCHSQRAVEAKQLSNFHSSSQQCQNHTVWREQNKILCYFHLIWNDWLNSKTVFCLYCHQSTQQLQINQVHIRKWSMFSLVSRA